MFGRSLGVVGRRPWRCLLRFFDLFNRPGQSFLLWRCSVSALSVTTLYLLIFFPPCFIPRYHLHVSVEAGQASVHNPATAKHLSLIAMSMGLRGIPRGHDTPFDSPDGKFLCFCY